MFKGMVIASRDAGFLIQTLKAAGLLYIEVPGGSAGSFERAAGELGCSADELLALVETDADERFALAAGLYCVGYANPHIKPQGLWGCSLLLTGFEEVDIPLLENTLTRAKGLPVTVAVTERLIIREMTADDPWESDREKAQAYIKYMYGLCQFGIWTVAEAVSGAVVGRVGFGIADFEGYRGPDFGYFIEEPYRRRGYAYEACRAVLDYAAEVLGFQSVTAFIEDENEISAALARKLGFVKDDGFEHGGRAMHRYVLHL